ncbi:MAG: pseudouridine synthase [Bacteroidia bacterium]
MVHTLKLTNKEAQVLIDTGAIKIDGQSITENCMITDNSEIILNGKIVRRKKEFVYLLFNKSVGYESTLNKNIENNLSHFFKEFENLAIAGRLDKQSEGLMILSNDGKWVENLCNPKFEKEKEYIVTLNKPITDIFVEAFKNGVEIDGFITKKCFCEKIDPINIKVILTEGKNRQIRKMCKVLGFNVLTLKRIRVEGFLLADLPENNFKVIKI